MRSTLCLALLLPAVVLAAKTEVALPTDLALAVGKQQKLKIPRLSRCSLGDVKVADLEPGDENTLVLTGMSEGETVLRVWQTGTPEHLEIRIHVAKGGVPPPAKIAAAVDRRPAQAIGKDLTLKVGEERVVAFPGITRVAVGDSDTMAVKFLGDNRLALTAGKQAADTTLIVWAGDSHQLIPVHVTK